MKIKTFNDFKNLKKGTWIEDASGISEVVTTFNERNSCIGLSAVEGIDVERGTYTLSTNENPNVTFADVKGAEIVG